MPGPHSIVAVYPDPEGARRATDALRRVGFQAADVSVERRPAEAAADAPATTERDRRVAGHTVRWGTAGAVMGSLLGTVIGVVSAAIALGGFSGFGVWAAAIGGAIAGGAVGAVLTGLATQNIAEGWEPGANGVRIRVRSDDPGQLERAADILRKEDAVSVVRGNEKPRGG